MCGGYFFIWTVSAIKTLTAVNNAIIQPKAPHQCGADVYCLSFSSALQMQNRNLFYLQVGSVFIRHSHMLTSEKVARAGRGTDVQ
jgi:hypothetical protein